MEKQLLIDYLPFKVSPETINESLKIGNLLRVKGILQKAATKNGNGRVYPREVLIRETKKYLDGPIKENRSLGELDHPESSVINLSNCSHIVRQLWWDNDDLWGELEILSTPSGNIARELLKNGVTLGISSRGMGSVQQIGETVEVQDDFELLCWDLVSTPSTPGAYVSPLKEGLEFGKNSAKYGKVNEIITDILCSRGYCSCELPK